MSVVAFVLDPQAVAGTDAVHFAGFPGAWTPGIPIEASEFVNAGAFASEKDMQAKVKELDLPLKKTTVDAGSGPMPVRDNHAYPGTAEEQTAVDEAPSEPVEAAE